VTAACPSTTSIEYADWKAPAGDEQFLIWPQPADLLTQTLENQRALSNCQCVQFQGVSLAELRRETRQWIGHDHDQPLVATGHQTELYHPGVWIKNALIDAAATKLGGQAYHLAVETDEPKHLLLSWPGVQHPITDDPQLSTARWSGLLAPPTPAHLNELMSSLRKDAAEWPFQPCAGHVLQTMRRQLLESDNLPSLIVNATHELDWDLGLRHHALLMSPVWTTRPYLLFVHHLLAHASELAADYNAALADYRRRHDIRAPGRPMPDLAISDDDVECPFWLDDLDNGTRSRLHVQRRGNLWHLSIGGSDGIAFDPSATADAAAEALGTLLRQTRYRIAPRALTLTLFIRLMLADNFIHGIGGGRYDQVLDTLIQRHFRIKPPHFGVTTATLYFPTAVGRQRVCLPCLQQQGHHLRHNLLPDKPQIVAAIAQAPRLSRERSLLFSQMHQRLADARQNDPRLRQWQQRWQDALKRDHEDRVLFNRELFYALQPRERLIAMIDQYRSAFA